jgi:hypothetical protein
MVIRHSTVATATDEAGAEVNKAEWNDDHVIDDSTLSIAKTSGLQAALDAKATVTQLNTKQATITDGDLTIARTNGLQAAIDGAGGGAHTTQDWTVQSSAPSDPSSGTGTMYVKTIDDNNQGLFIKIKKNGSIVEVQVG